MHCLAKEGRKDDDGVGAKGQEANWGQGKGGRGERALGGKQEEIFSR